MSEANYKRITCAQCNTEFTAKRKRAFCSDKCKWRAKTLARNPGAVVRRSEFHRSCKQCGKAYLYHPAGSDKGHEHKRGLFCSSACRMADNAANRPLLFSAIYTGHCLGCGNPFTSKNCRTRYCSDACWPEREKVSVAPTVKSCKCCGNSYKPLFTGGRPSEYCGDVCAQLIDSARSRIAKSKRAAVLKGATIESVDPFKVFDRDRWKCQLCGIKTPKTKRGTYDDNAPELDHIQPLAKGGEHSYLNTQCACRKCNGLKSDTPMGQMLMFG